MIGRVQLPGPLSRVPLAWVIAVIAFAISGFFVATKGVNGNALIFAAVGVIFLVRGGMVFVQRMRRPQAAAEPGVVDPAWLSRGRRSPSRRRARPSRPHPRALALPQQR